MSDDDYGYEGWALAQTSVRDYYGYWDVLDDAGVGKGVGQPKWCQPHRTWADGRRQHRNQASSVSSHDTRDSDTTTDKADRDLSHQMDAGSGGETLLAFHMETNGGTGSSPKGGQGWTRGYGFEKKSNPDQLEVCRNQGCGKALDLRRDEFGYAIREFETQRQYCSDRCEADADNRRDRQRRAGGAFRREYRWTWFNGADYCWRSSWHAQAPESADIAGQQRRRRLRHPKVHTYRGRTGRSVTTTCSGENRLQLPWSGEPDVWAIRSRVGAVIPWEYVSSLVKHREERRLSTCPVTGQLRRKEFYKIVTR